MRAEMRQRYALQSLRPSRRTKRLCKTGESAGKLSQSVSSLCFCDDEQQEAKGRPIHQRLGRIRFSANKRSDSSVKYDRGVACTENMRLLSTAGVRLRARHLVFLSRPDSVWSLTSSVSSHTDDQTSHKLSLKGTEANGR